MRGRTLLGGKRVIRGSGQAGKRSQSLTNDRTKRSAGNYRDQPHEFAVFSRIMPAEAAEEIKEGSNVR